MSSKAASLSLFWPPGLAASVEVRRRWVLTGMGRLGPALVQMLWRILGNEEDVCDAYQDTFLQLSHVAAGRKPVQIKSYLFRTASNEAITTLRRRKRYEAACRQVAQRARGLEQAGAVAEFDARLLREELRVQMVRLPDHLRQVILLRDLGEISYPQVAQILNISQATARVYRHWAVQMLAVWMNHRENGDL